MSSTMLTLTPSPAALVAIVTVVVIMTMADPTRVKIVSRLVLAMAMMLTVAMVLAVMATVFSVFLHRWDYVSIRLCNWFLFALFWCLSALPKNDV